MYGKLYRDERSTLQKVRKEQNMQEMQEGLKVAKRLETYLNDLIWSQAELARRTGLSVVTINRAMHDLPITKASALKIARAIGEELGERLTIRDFTGLKVEAVTMKKRDTRKKKGMEE